MPNDYSNERYNPALAHCTTLALHFNGKELTMIGGVNTYIYPTVSGKRKSDGQFDFSLVAQTASFSGPIPQGKYWIRPDELWERTILRKLYFQLFVNENVRQAHERGWGNFRITIHPFTTTQTYNRGGFFIHGGIEAGSAGCIDLTNNMPKFVNDLRKETALRKCQIHLSVVYSNSK